MCCRYHSSFPTWSVCLFVLGNDVTGDSGVSYPQSHVDHRRACVLTQVRATSSFFRPFITAKKVRIPLVSRRSPEIFSVDRIVVLQ